MRSYMMRQRSIRKHLTLQKYKECYYCYKKLSFCTITQNDPYIAPTPDQLEEYTRNIASVIHSWPTSIKDYFIATLHKAQANPRRNKNYDHILSHKSKIPKNYLHPLDINKLKQWLPYVYVTDIIKYIDDIQHSAMLATIHDSEQLVSYNENNPNHKQILHRIKTEHYDKMVWIQDLPMNVTDRKLAEIFGKFGEIAAITMDRYQSVKQHKWLQWKQEELAQTQKDELSKTIHKLNTNMVRNAMKEYQQQYLKIELDIDNKSEILRLIMAHLQHQFDINDIEFIDDNYILIPVCLNSTASEILSTVQDANFYHELGNIIISISSDGEMAVRNALNEHPLVENVRKSAKPKAGTTEMEITFTSKLEASIKDFIESLCASYYNINKHKLHISHHTPYRIPQWWRDMHEQTEHEFFSNTIEDTDKAISQRINKISNEGDEDLARLLDTNTQDATCSAFVYFKDIDAVHTVICSHTKLWGMVINGQRCRVSTAPTQLQLKHVPYDAANPVRYTPLFTPSTKHLNDIIPDTYYDADGNIIPPILKRNITRERSHIPIGSEHVQISAPFVNINHLKCDGLQSVYAQTTRFEHDFSMASLTTRLEHEAPAGISASGTVAERTHLLMKHSNTINIGLPLIGGVIQYMLALIPMHNNNNGEAGGMNKFYSGDSVTTPYYIDAMDNISQIKNMPIVANKARIHINDTQIDNALHDRIGYLWKHASCIYENENLMWFLDDSVGKYAVKKKKEQEKIFVRMGYICVHSKRYRKVRIISHGLRTWNGSTVSVLHQAQEKETSDDVWDNDEGFDDDNDLVEWGINDDIDDNTSETIAKSVNVDREYMDDDDADTNVHHATEREYDLHRGQQMFVYTNGNKHKFSDDKEAMILHKGWNHILIDFGFNDMNHGSFQIVDFNQQTEIHELSWRYTPPPMSLIMKFNDHSHAMQMYDKLQTAKQKRYGVKVELCNHDDKYLENETILQTEMHDEHKDEYEYDEDDVMDLLDIDMNDLSYNNINGHDDHKEFYNAKHGLLESFANEIIENIHQSQKQFDDKSNAQIIYDHTGKYEKMLADYNPSQMLQYSEDTTHSNMTQMFSTALNVPSTLELLDRDSSII